MAEYLLDSSALVKQYVVEAGSNWVRSLLLPSAGNVIYAAQVAEVEIVAAVARRARGGTIIAADASVAIRRIRLDFQAAYNIITLSPALIRRAVDVAEAYALRGYDAVQLASLLEANDLRARLGLDALVLVSADLELNAAATACAVTVEDPTTHK